MNPPFKSRRVKLLYDSVSPFCLLSVTGNRDIFLLLIVDVYSFLFYFRRRKPSPWCIAFLVVIFQGFTQHQTVLVAVYRVTDIIRSVSISKKKYNYILYWYYNALHSSWGGNVRLQWRVSPYDHNNCAYKKFRKEKEKRGFTLVLRVQFYGNHTTLLTASDSISKKWQKRALLNSYRTAITEIWYQKTQYSCF